jgi:hypothetical protein
MFVIPTADDLITFILDFTGSTNSEEIKKCIFMAEMSMRNIELPALRCNPYLPENIGIADQNGRIPIPGDMNKPILFFKQGQQYITNATATGVNGENTIVLTSTPMQSLTVGMYVTGSNVGIGATITATGTGISGGTVTLSIPNIGTVDGELLFTTTANTSSQTGPWIVYDRIGDRDIITQGMVAQLYLQPVNVPAVIRGKFSEVGQEYQFLPYVAEGDLINMYYYKAWPLLFSPADDQTVALTGEITQADLVGDVWICTITIEDSSVFTVGDNITANPDGGSFGTTFTSVTVDSIVSSTEIQVTVVGSDGVITGAIVDIAITNITVQSNAVLSTWPEGYVYATLREYYIKRHNDQDASVYSAKFENAYNIVEDQNSKGKWSGGHTRLTSVWQPRQYRQYNIK